MSSVPRAPFLAPFRQRSFRFQWPADLATSWAFEMETLILAWFVLTETGSVVWLTVFGSLQFVGTLISPMFGVAGDRIGHRRVLFAMRAAYAVLAGILAALALTGTLGIAAVFVIALLSGLVRPSDIGMRNALVGATMPAAYLMGAMGIERMSADTARVVGALTGAALVAVLGVGQAYLVVTGLYMLSLVLMLGVAEGQLHAGAAAAGSAAGRVWRDLMEGAAYVRGTPPLLAAMCLAFLANLLAYPLTGGLLPHVARNIYGMDQTGLGTLMACFAFGALAGSLILSARGPLFPPARTMLAAAAIWFALLIAFARVESAGTGMVLLALTGFVQSFCMVPMSVMLLRVSRDALRGRVMGLRMLAIYGLPVGLLGAGPLIGWTGFAETAVLYAGVGLACTLAIAWHWRGHLLPREAQANAVHA
ncbi:MFS transporter [Neoroseomonas soli]|uniref:MFS transporter n=1 Tax=Neoroseomonas soli TaxID=1081025 RepID=UPI0030B9B1AC